VEKLGEEKVKEKSSTLVLTEPAEVSICTSLSIALYVYM